MTRILHVLDHSLPLQSGYTFRTRAILAAQIALGLDVRLSQTFADACERIRQGGFDVLLSDLRLDGGHIGLDLLPVLRASPGGASVPALIVSAFGSQAHREASLRAGFAAHLVKPIDGIEMARALLAVLGAPRSA